MNPETALALCRFVHDGATMLVWGAFAYLAALVPRDLALSVAAGLARFRVTAVIVAVMTTLAALPLAAATIGNGWADAADRETVGAILFETSVGPAFLAQTAAALLLAITLALPASLRLSATAAASGLLLATLALTGHAAMHENWRGVVHRVNDAVHVLAGGAWLGSLVPLLLVLRALHDAAQRNGAGIALRRFSNAGHGAVALVIATGVGNTMLILGRWPLDWSSPYQALLAAKVALVAVMTLLALANRYILVPRMTRDRFDALRPLKIATIVEIGLGFAVLACVSIFGRLEPI